MEAGLVVRGEVVEEAMDLEWFGEGSLACCKAINDLLHASHIVNCAITCTRGDEGRREEGGISGLLEFWSSGDHQGRFKGRRVRGNGGRRGFTEVNGCRGLESVRAAEEDVEDAGAVWAGRDKEAPRWEARATTVWRGGGDAGGCRCSRGGGNCGSGGGGRRRCEIVAVGRAGDHEQVAAAGCGGGDLRSRRRDVQAATFRSRRWGVQAATRSRGGRTCRRRQVAAVGRAGGDEVSRQLDAQAVPEEARRRKGGGGYWGVASTGGGGSGDALAAVGSAGEEGTISAGRGNGGDGAGRGEDMLG
ncbi:unnamed protein product [Closterium sp. NIES-64]|nr:unnamed protein product [Closterium sp. NIES-64]